MHGNEDTGGGAERIVGLMINPTSRRTRKHMDRILAIARDREPLHHCVTADGAKVKSGLADLAAAGVNVLAICGGDGTVSRVLTFLLEDRPFDPLPLVAILPGGTANMTAGDLGLSGPVHRALRRLREWAEEDRVRPEFLRRSVLRVCPGVAQPAHCGMFFGAGAIVQGVEYTNANIHSRGLKHELSLGAGLVRSMWGIARQDPRFIRPAAVSISIDGRSAEHAPSLVLLLVSSLQRLFLNMRPYWGEEHGKALHTTIVQSPATRLIRTLPALLRGKPNRHLTAAAGYRSYNIDRIALGFDGPFTLDGEILHASAESGPVEISVGGELTFLRLPN